MTKSSKKELLVLTSLIFLLSIVAAEVKIDITGLDTEEYNSGSELKFEVLLLDDQTKISGDIDLVISDVSDKIMIKRIIKSNEEVRIDLEERFPNGLWTIKATYEEETIERSFSIKEDTSVEFSILDGKLIIRNTGNTRYQKTIQIKIGETKQSKTLSIAVGEQKEWQLVAPDGEYDIFISDGTTEIRKSNIKLVGGTGNVIGAIDENLIGYSGFGTTPVKDLEDRFISLNKLPMTIIFLVVVFGLGILIAIERSTRKRETGAPKGQVVQNVV